LSDDFSTNKFGIQWSFYDPSPDELQRVRISDHTLFLKAKGTGPRDTSPICFIAGDPAYEFEADLEIDEQARAGLLLFYSRRLYCGLAFDNENFVMHRYGQERNGTKPAGVGRHLRLKIKNDRHIVTVYHRVDAGPWTKFSNQFEVSGYHHNVAGDFLSLRPAIYAAGTGEVRIRDVRYTAV